MRGSFLRVTVAAILFACLCISVVGCGAGDSSEEQEKQVVRTEDAAGLEWNVSVLENSEGQLVFDCSIEDFIDSFNSLYQRDNGKKFLPPAYEWTLYNAMAVHGDNEVLCRDFSQDADVRAVPVISVYVPAAGDGIQQIMVRYDDHSYSIPTYEMYEELCFHTLRTMMPELSDEEAAELSTRINDVADENITDVPYGVDAVPCVLYYNNGTGVYPYYAAGEEIHFCIIPVTEELLDDFAEQGTQIIEAGS